MMDLLSQGSRGQAQREGSNSLLRSVLFILSPRCLSSRSQGARTLATFASQEPLRIARACFKRLALI
jgi:hypothetical protein